MSEMIARCGFKCHACMAFKDNNMTPADQARVAEGWLKYFGLTVSPETIRCNGCMAQDRGGYDFPSLTCPIAPCVVERGLDNCAACADYPCAKIEELMRVCEQVKARFQGSISADEFDRFIAPYDARATLSHTRGRRATRLH